MGVSLVKNSHFVFIPGTGYVKRATRAAARSTVSLDKAPLGRHRLQSNYYRPESNTVFVCADGAVRRSTGELIGYHSAARSPYGLDVALEVGQPY